MLQHPKLLAQIHLNPARLLVCVGAPLSVCLCLSTNAVTSLYMPVLISPVPVGTNRELRLISRLYVNVNASKYACTYIYKYKLTLCTYVMYACLHLFIHPPTEQPTSLSACPSTSNLSTDVPTYRPIHPSIHPSIHLSAKRHAKQQAQIDTTSTTKIASADSEDPAIHAPTHPASQPSIHLSIHPFYPIRPSNPSVSTCQLSLRLSSLVRLYSCTPTVYAISISFSLQKHVFV